LSKINTKDVSTRIVRFPLEDFQAIMNLGRINIKHMESTTSRLLCKIIKIRNENGGYTQFQLFKQCTVDKDDNDDWYVEIDAHDKALPLMFEFKEKYFKYHLWNALRLQSANQLRMYEILKQYENIGFRILGIDELRELLGLSSREYPRFGDFKTYVLNSCQKALALHTDIKFSYEPYGKKGKGGKILQLKLIIEKNTDYVSQMNMSMFGVDERRDELFTPTAPDIPIAPIETPVDYIDDGQMTIDDYDNNIDIRNDYDSSVDIGDDPPVFVEKIRFLMDACMDEFSYLQMKVIHGEIKENFCFLATHQDQLDCYHFLVKKINYMNLMHSKNPITHRFNYFLKLLRQENE